MSSASVKEFGKAWWSEVYNRLSGALVFMEDPSCECLHWEGGLVNLMSAGAVGVKNLSLYENGRENDKKAVFITQTTSDELTKIRRIIQQSHFDHCILISCISLDVVYLEMNDDKNVSEVIAAGKGPAEATKLLEGMLSEWMAKKPSVVEVVHIPIFTIALTNVVFVTPPYSEVYPTFNGKLLPKTGDLDLNSLSSTERSKARRLASGLNSLLDSMNLKEDVYFMGPYSYLLAGILQNSPVCLARRKNCLHPASLIIIDRTLDVFGVTSHSTESMLDKILAVLPRFPCHTNEVAVDMSLICESNTVTHPTDVHISAGCLSHVNDDVCTQIYDYMINKPQNEVMFELYNKLSKIDIQKSPSPKKLVKVTPQSVEKIVTATKGNYDIIAKHLGLLQQAIAVVLTLKSSRRFQLELLMRLERQVLQNLAASRDSTSVLQQINQLIKTRTERNLPLKNILALLVQVYSLIGTEVSLSKEHEDSIVKTIGFALHDDGVFNTYKKIGRVFGSPEACEEIAQGMMAQLRDLAQTRKILQKYNSVLKPYDTGMGYEYRGVLQQLVDDLVDTERPEMVDLKHKNDGIKDLLRSGLNILTSKKTRSVKHPMDNHTVILFVVGGMTAEECKRLHRSVITSGVDNTVLIGSTKLVRAVDAARDVLSLDRC